MDETKKSSKKKWIKQRILGFHNIIIVSVHDKTEWVNAKTIASDALNNIGFLRMNNMIKCKHMYWEEILFKLILIVTACTQKKGDIL